MNELPVRLGPLALLLTVVSICLTTLCVLTVTTAQADLRLSEKYAKTVQERYELEAEGQRELAALREGKSLLLEEPDGTFRLELEQDNAKLTALFRKDGDGYEVVSWRHERAWKENDSIGELWGGFAGLPF